VLVQQYQRAVQCPEILTNYYQKLKLFAKIFSKFFKKSRKMADLRAEQDLEYQMSLMRDIQRTNERKAQEWQDRQLAERISEVAQSPTDSKAVRWTTWAPPLAELTIIRGK
jgi:hypothetical protein